MAEELAAALAGDGPGVSEVPKVRDALPAGDDPLVSDDG